MKNKIGKGFMHILLVMLVFGCLYPLKTQAATTKATVKIGSEFAGSSFGATDTIKIPVEIHKYSKDDDGYYYVNVYNESKEEVASDSGFLSDLIVGTTDLTVFWKYDKNPHKIGKYTIEYYTSNDEGGESWFTVDRASGKTGRLNWTIDKKGILSITGSGVMPNYDEWDGAPWAYENDFIKEIKIQNGITSIGECAFYEMANLEKVSIPNSVRTMGESALSQCPNLQKVVLPDKIRQLPSYCFDGDTNLRVVKIPATLEKFDYNVFRGTNLEHIYYGGSKAMWKLIENVASQKVKGAQIHYGMKQIAKSAIKSYKVNKDSSLTLNLKTVKGVDGYEIRYTPYVNYIDDVNDSGYHNVRVKGANTKSKKLNDVYGSGTWYVKVRAYKKQNGIMNYSDWTSIKKIKLE